MPKNNRPIISLKDVRVKWNSQGSEKTTLHNLNFDIFDGEFLAIIGKSTSGKTLLTRVLTNNFSPNSYISNGSAMYYPSVDGLDESNNGKIKNSVDLISYHKSLLKSPTQKLIFKTNSSIIEKASIKLMHFRSLIAIMQLKEAKIQTKKYLSIYKKTLSMKKKDKHFYLTADYAKNKTDSINNRTSPPIDTISEIINKMINEEKKIASAYLDLSQAPIKNESPHWANIKRSTAKIEGYKDVISNIQVYTAKTNYKFLKKLKTNIKQLGITQFADDIEVSQKSIMRMHEFNEVLKLEDNAEMLKLISKIEEQQAIIDHASFELENFLRMSHKKYRRFKPVIKQISENRDNIQMVDSDLVNNCLAFLNSLRFLNQFEIDLKSLLEKINEGKIVSQNAISSLLEIWKYKTQSTSKNLQHSNKEVKKFIESTIVKIDQDPMFNLKPNISIGKQIEKAISSHTKLDKISLKENALNWLYSVGIINAEDSYFKTPINCPASIKKLASIAVALAHHPKILIMDNATNDLGAVLQKEILSLIISCKKQFKFTLIMITNNLGIVNEYADRIAVMDNGRVVEYGPSNELFSSPINSETKDLLQPFSNKINNLNSINTTNIFEIFSSNNDAEQTTNNNILNYHTCDESASPLISYSKAHFARTKKSLIKGGQ